MAKRTRKELGISDAEYEIYKHIRRARNKIIKQLNEDAQRMRNITYREHLKPLRKKEYYGKQFTIGDFRSKAEFDNFLRTGQKYFGYKRYLESKAMDYIYNLRQSLFSIGSSNEQIARFDRIIRKMKNKWRLNEIFSMHEELDIAFVYIEVYEEGIERIDAFLDVLETLIDEDEKIQASGLKKVNKMGDILEKANINAKKYRKKL